MECDLTLGEKSVTGDQESQSWRRTGLVVGRSIEMERFGVRRGLTGIRVLLFVVQEEVSVYDGV